MPRRAAIGKIRRPSGGAKDVSVACTVSLWYYVSGGSLLVHPSAVINIPFVSSASNSSTNIQTPKGGVVPITVLPSVIWVGVDSGWLNIRVVTIHSVGTEGEQNSY